MQRTETGLSSGWGWSGGVIAYLGGEAQGGGAAEAIGLCPGSEGQRGRQGGPGMAGAPLGPLLKKWCQCQVSLCRLWPGHVGGRGSSQAPVCGPGAHPLKQSLDVGWGP